MSTLLGSSGREALDLSHNQSTQREVRNEPIKAQQKL